MDVAKLLPQDYYSVEEDEMQPENSYTEEITGGITEGITGGISSVDTLTNVIETTPSNINQLREYLHSPVTHYSSSVISQCPLKPRPT